MGMPNTFDLYTKNLILEKGRDISTSPNPNTGIKDNEGGGDTGGTGSPEITLPRQDLVQDHLKESEKKIAPVEAKTRPPYDPQRGQDHDAQALPPHPLLVDKAYFSGIDQSVLPHNSPEAQEAYLQLQNELALRRQMRQRVKETMQLGR
jgi:hypothetical protein